MQAMQNSVVPIEEDPPPNRDRTSQNQQPTAEEYVSN